MFVVLKVGWVVYVDFFLVWFFVCVLVFSYGSRVSISWFVWVICALTLFLGGFNFRASERYRGLVFFFFVEFLFLVLVDWWFGVFL